MWLREQLSIITIEASKEKRAEIKNSRNYIFTMLLHPKSSHIKECQEFNTVKRLVPNKTQKEKSVGIYSVWSPPFIRVVDDIWMRITEQRIRRNFGSFRNLLRSPLLNRWRRLCCRSRLFIQLNFNLPSNRRSVNRQRVSDGLVAVTFTHSDS